MKKSNVENRPLVWYNYCIITKLKLLERVKDLKKKFILLFLFLSFALLLFNKESSAKQKNYVVSPKTAVSGNYKKSKSLNKNTRHYFMLRYYMDQLEKNGGGKLTIKKGTYTITNILYVPSNVTIQFEDGVKFVKSKKVGNAEFKAADGIFQVVPYKLSQKTRKGKGYSGSKNVKFIGKGKVTFDLKNIKDSKAIVTAHCQNVLVENITFLNMNTGHFLEVDATKNLTVRNCTFKGVAAGSPYTKEAINIDTPDPLTGGVNLTWSSLDRTPESDVLIENCTFSNLQRGIGTHKYSQKKSNGQWSINCYHENITIQNNTFSNIKDTAIFMLNWKSVKILENTFLKCNLCMNFRGVQAPVDIYHNDFGDSTVVQTFQGSKNTIYYMGYTSPGKGSEYSPIYNNLGFTDLYQLLELNNRT